MMFITDKALISGNQVAIRNGSYSPTFFTNVGLNDVTVTASKDGVIFTNLFELATNQTKHTADVYFYYKMLGSNPVVYVNSEVNWWEPTNNNNTGNVDLTEVNQKISALTTELNGKATPQQIAEAINKLIGGADSSSDTLKELADMISSNQDTTDYLQNYLNERGAI